MNFRKHLQPPLTFYALVQARQRQYGARLINKILAGFFCRPLHSKPKNLPQGISWPGPDFERVLPLGMGHTAAPRSSHKRLSQQKAQIWVTWVMKFIALLKVFWNFAQWDKKVRSPLFLSILAKWAPIPNSITQLTIQSTRNAIPIILIPNKSVLLWD